MEFVGYGNDYQIYMSQVLDLVEVFLDPEGNNVAVGLRYHGSGTVNEEQLDLSLPRGWLQIGAVTVLAAVTLRTYQYDFNSISSLRGLLVLG